MFLHLTLTIFMQTTKLTVGVYALVCTHALNQTVISTYITVLYELVIVASMLFALDKISCNLTQILFSTSITSYIAIIYIQNQRNIRMNRKQKTNIFIRIITYSILNTCFMKERIPKAGEIINKIIKNTNKIQ